MTLSSTVLNQKASVHSLYSTPPQSEHCQILCKPSELFLTQIMENTEDLVAFKEFRRISWFFRVYNRENFHVRNRTILWRHIAEAAFFSFTLVMFGLEILSGILYCFDYEFDLKKTSMVAPVVISLVQIVFIYPALAANNRKMTQMIDSLQQIIRKREIFVVFFFCQCVCVHWGSNM